MAAPYDDVDICVTCVSDKPPQLPLREELVSLGVEVVYRARGTGARAAREEKEKALNEFQEREHKKAKKRWPIPRSPKKKRKKREKRERIEKELSSLKSVSYEEYLGHLSKNEKQNYSQSDVVLSQTDSSDTDVSSLEDSRSDFLKTESISFENSLREETNHTDDDEIENVESSGAGFARLTTSAETKSPLRSNKQSIPQSSDTGIDMTIPQMTHAYDTQPVHHNVVSPSPVASAKDDAVEEALSVFANIGSVAAAESSLAAVPQDSFEGHSTSGQQSNTSLVTDPNCEVSYIPTEEAPINSSVESEYAKEQAISEAFNVFGAESSILSDTPKSMASSLDFTYSLSKESTENTKNMIGIEHKSQRPSKAQETSPPDKGLGGLISASGSDSSDSWTDHSKETAVSSGSTFNQKEVQNNSVGLNGTTVDFMSADADAIRDSIGESETEFAASDDNSSWGASALTKISTTLYGDVGPHKQEQSTSTPVSDTENDVNAPLSKRDEAARNALLAVLSRASPDSREVQMIAQMNPIILRKCSGKDGRLPFHAACDKVLPVRKLSRDCDDSDSVLKGLRMDITNHLELLESLASENQNACSVLDVHGDLPLHLLAKRLIVWEDNWVTELLGTDAWTTSSSAMVEISLITTACIEIALRPIASNRDYCRARGSEGRILPLHIAAWFKASSRSLRLLLESYPEAAKVPCDFNGIVSTESDSRLPLELFESSRGSNAFSAIIMTNSADVEEEKEREKLINSDLRSDLIFAFNPGILPYRRDLNRIVRMGSMIKEEANTLSREEMESDLTPAANSAWFWLCTFDDGLDDDDNYLADVADIVNALDSSVVKKLAMAKKSDGTLLLDVALPECVDLIKARIASGDTHQTEAARFAHGKPEFAPDDITYSDADSIRQEYPQVNPEQEATTSEVEVTQSDGSSGGETSNSSQVSRVSSSKSEDLDYYSLGSDNAEEGEIDPSSAAQSEPSIETGVIDAQCQSPDDQTSDSGSQLSYIPGPPLKIGELDGGLSAIGQEPVAEIGHCIAPESSDEEKSEYSNVSVARSAGGENYEGGSNSASTHSVSEQSEDAREKGLSDTQSHTLSPERNSFALNEETQLLQSTDKTPPDDHHPLVSSEIKEVQDIPAPVDEKVNAGALCKMIFNVKEESFPTNFVIMPYKLKKAPGGNLTLESPEYASVAMKFAQCLLNITTPSNIFHVIEKKAVEHLGFKISPSRILAWEELDMKNADIELILLSLFESNKGYLYFLDESNGVPVVPSSSNEEPGYPIEIENVVDAVERLLPLMLMGMVRMRGEKAAVVLAKTILQGKEYDAPQSWITASQQMIACFHSTGGGGCDGSLGSTASELDSLSEELKEYADQVDSNEKPRRPQSKTGCEWIVELSFMKALLENAGFRRTYAGLSPTEGVRNIVVWATKAPVAEDPSLKTQDVPQPETVNVSLSANVENRNKLSEDEDDASVVSRDKDSSSTTITPKDDVFSSKDVDIGNDVYAGDSSERETAHTVNAIVSEHVKNRNNLGKDDDDASVSIEHDSTPKDDISSSEAVEIVDDVSFFERVDKDVDISSAERLEAVLEDDHEADSVSLAEASSCVADATKASDTDGMTSNGDTSSSRATIVLDNRKELKESLFAAAMGDFPVGVTPSRSETSSLGRQSTSLESRDRGKPNASLARFLESNPLNLESRRQSAMDSQTSQERRTAWQRSETSESHMSDIRYTTSVSSTDEEISPESATNATSSQSSFNFSHFEGKYGDSIEGTRSHASWPSNSESRSAKRIPISDVSASDWDESATIEKPAIEDCVIMSRSNSSSSGRHDLPMNANDDRDTVLLSRSGSSSNSKGENELFLQETRNDIAVQEATASDLRETRNDITVQEAAAPEGFGLEIVWDAQASQLASGTSQDDSSTDSSTSLGEAPASASPVMNKNFHPWDESGDSVKYSEPVTSGSYNCNSGDSSDNETDFSGAVGFQHRGRTLSNQQESGPILQNKAIGSDVSTEHLAVKEKWSFGQLRPPTPVDPSIADKDSVEEKGSEPRDDKGTTHAGMPKLEECSESVMMDIQRATSGEQDSTSWVEVSEAGDASGFDTVRTPEGSTHESKIDGDVSDTSTSESRSAVQSNQTSTHDCSRASGGEEDSAGLVVKSSTAARSNTMGGTMYPARTVQQPRLDSEDESSCMNLNEFINQNHNGSVSDYDSTFAVGSSQPDRNSGAVSASSEYIGEAASDTSSSYERYAEETVLTDVSKMDMRSLTTDTLGETSSSSPFSPAESSSRFTSSEYKGDSTSEAHTIESLPNDEKATVSESVCETADTHSMYSMDDASRASAVSMDSTVSLVARLCKLEQQIRKREVDLQALKLDVHEFEMHIAVESFDEDGDDSYGGDTETVDDASSERDVVDLETKIIEMVASL